VLVAIEQLTRLGLLATSKATGRSTAYKIIRPAPERPSRSKASSAPAAARQQPAENLTGTGPTSLEVSPRGGPKSLEVKPPSGPKSGPAPAQSFGLAGPEGRPEQEPSSKQDQTASIPIPGTPFRITAEGRLLVAVDLQELLTNQGIPGHLAQGLVTQKDPEAVAKVLLNALYLESQGKLQNGPGYIRAGIEDGYDLLPQVASRLEGRRRELEAQLRKVAARQEEARAIDQHLSEQAAIASVLEQLNPRELDQLVEQAVRLLPEPVVRRNPTLSNPFVRGKVYELACERPAD
jgi:hypothetical protein